MLSPYAVTVNPSYISCKNDGKLRIGPTRSNFIIFFQLIIFKNKILLEKRIVLLYYFNEPIFLLGRHGMRRNPVIFKLGPQYLFGADR